MINLCQWYSNLSKKFKDRLQVCQNKMIRSVLGLDSRSHIGLQEFLSVKWIPVKYRVKQLKLNHVYKIINSLSPSYLQENFSFRSNLHSHHTRGNTLAIFKPRVGGNSLNSFFYTAIEAWNELPDSIRISTSLDSF